MVSLAQFAASICCRIDALSRCCSGSLALTVFKESAQKHCKVRKGTERKTPELFIFCPEIATKKCSELWLKLGKRVFCWAAANGGVTDGGLRGVWPPFLEVGLLRPFSAFFCLFCPFPEGPKSRPFSSDMLKPPFLKPSFAAPRFWKRGLFRKSIL